MFLYFYFYFPLTSFKIITFFRSGSVYGGSSELPPLNRLLSGAQSLQAKKEKAVMKSTQPNQKGIRISETNSCVCSDFWK